MTNKHRFKVNLKGMIKLLSDNIYSNPSAYLRELLQNAVDAISARYNNNDNDFEPKITIEVTRGAHIEMCITDNGIGLNEQEIHDFIGSIGSSSKGDTGTLTNDYIGRFGIGLLSCFVVSEEIKIISKSPKSNKAYEWCGYSDGNYQVKESDDTLTQGTKVIIRSKANSEMYFEDDYVIRHLKDFGGLLPYDITYTYGNMTVIINEDRPTWFDYGKIKEAPRNELLSFGRKVFNEDFLECIPLESEVGGVCGIAFILPYQTTTHFGADHRVYLKNMLLSDSNRSLIPKWAFFVKCILNVNDLEPTASREDFHKNDKLLLAKDYFGETIKKHFIDILNVNTILMREIMSIHGLGIKGMVADDLDMLEMFIDHLTFETSQGAKSLRDIKEKNAKVYYVTKLDEYKQIVNISYSRSVCILNAAYAYDIQIIESSIKRFQNTDFIELNAISFLNFFESATDEENFFYKDFIDITRKIIDKYSCSLSLKKFEPNELSALYLTSNKGRIKRYIQSNMDVSDGLFDHELNQLIEDHYVDKGHPNELCLNLNSQIIMQLIASNDIMMISRMIELIYVQTLLMGHHQLQMREYQILENSLSYMIGTKEVVSSTFVM